jgi:uncharacterized protein
MRVVLYGGFAEKGRTSVGVESDGYRLLLDAGIKTSARGTREYYPAIDGSALRSMNAMLITHAHEDHVGALGWCIASGFSGRILMTPETRRESVSCLAGYAEPAHCALVQRAAIESLSLGHDVRTLGPFRISTGRSGHVAGGVWCHVDDGRAKLLYCGDVAPGSPVFAMDPPSRCDVLIIDASYADDATNAHARAAEITGWIEAHPHGCVLPTPLYGRSAELLAIVPGPVALAPGMRDALLAQIGCADWLADGMATRLTTRLDTASEWRTGDPLPGASLLCHDGMGISGPSAHALEQARAEAHPTLFTGHVPAHSPGERMIVDGRAEWIRLPTHPTLPENVAVVANCQPTTVLGHSCERLALIRLAQHMPQLRADPATGDSIAL